VTSLARRVELLVLAAGLAGCGRESPAAPAPPAPAEEPVVRREKWLGAHQSPDGRWEAEGFARWQSGKRVEAGLVNGLGKPENDVAVTALAVFAFLGAGNTSTSDGLGVAVLWGLHWLRGVQDTEGRFAPTSHPTWAVQHALATMAMATDAQLSRAPESVASAQRAIDLAATSLARGDAGWDSTAGPGGVEPVAWLMLAFHAGKHHRNTPPEDAVLRVPADVRDDVLARVAGWAEGEATDARRAAGVVALLLSGEDAKGAKVRAAVERIERRRPEWRTDDPDLDFTHWYWATNALYQVGGPPWKRWNDAMTHAVVASQRMDGDYCHVRGSWDPIDRWGAQGGRVYATAMLALCLEVYYRYDKV
jgi:hypothetical protein